MIIIDSDNYAEHGIETMFFPGGEPHVKIPRFKEMPLLFLKLRTWNDVGFASLLRGALWEQFKYLPMSFIPYFPGARQDRSDGTTAITVALMMGMFSGTPDTIVFDKHSPITHFRNMMPSDMNIPIKDDVVGIIAPDAGAAGRARNFRDAFYPNAYILQCTKNRDPHTGGLGNYAMPPLAAKGRYIIVDDICDGGGTFNLLAELWKRDPLAKHSKLEMFVSHGIFSKGLDAIDPVIEHITTTDSWCRGNSSIRDRLTVLPLLPVFLKFIGVQ